MKRVLMGILIGTMILGLLVSGISCTKTVYITATPTPTPALSTTPTPSPTSTPTPTPEPTIPPNFTTYTDDAKIFSISYPQDWEAPLWQLQDVEQSAKDLIHSINSNASVENAHVVFLAGKPVGGAWEPNIIVVVEPPPAGIWALDLIVEAEIQGIAAVFTDLHEFFRVTTNVGGKQATIIEFEVTSPNIGRVHDLQMYMIAGKNVWIVCCSTSTTQPTEYSDYESTFYDILRSFRIWK